MANIVDIIGAGLNHRFGIIIPSTQGVAGQDIDGKSNKWTRIAQEQFSNWFGGATTSQGEGAWMSESEGLVTEKVVTVNGHTNADGIKDRIRDVAGLAQEIAADMGQEAVTIIVDNSMHFIEAA